MLDQILLNKAMLSFHKQTNKKKDRDLWFFLGKKKKMTENLKSYTKQTKLYGLVI